MSLEGEVAENWEEFERAWNDYYIATGLDKKLKTEEEADDPAGQLVVAAATLCSAMETECRKILNNLPEVTEETRKNPDPIIKALRTYFLPQRNVLYKCFLFNSAVQKAGETVDQFVLRLRQLADTCEFDTLKDSLIRDRLVIGTKDEAGRERLLRKRPVPDLTVCVEDLRAAEASRSHKQAIMGAGTTALVDYMSRKGRKGKSQTQGHQSNSKQKYSHSQSRPQQQPQNSQRQPQNSQRQG